MVKKYGLLVGCNYPNTEVELKGCFNDVNSMRGQLGRFGFDKKDIEVLTDRAGSENMPTGANIRNVLKQMFESAKSGDVVFLYYSGHGTIIPKEYSSSKRDEEAIVPSDFDLITCVDFRAILKKAPDGVVFVLVSDSCHSGGLIDKEKEQIGPDNPPQSRLGHQEGNKMIPFEVVLQQLSRHAPVNTLVGVQTLFQQSFGSVDACSPIFGTGMLEVAGPLKPDLGILLSACQRDEYAMQEEFDGMVQSVYTHALIIALNKHPGPIPNKNLVIQVRNILQDSNYDDQHPCLYCSDENVEAFFLHEHLD